MNVFVDRWKAMGTTSEDEYLSPEVPKHLMLFKVFTEEKYAKGKKISTFNWHPTLHGKGKESQSVNTAVQRIGAKEFYIHQNTSQHELQQYLINHGFKCISGWNMLTKILLVDNVYSIIITNK